MQDLDHFYRKIKHSPSFSGNSLSLMLLKFLSYMLVFWSGISLKKSSSITNWNKWAEISIVNLPLVDLYSSEFIKILSIRVFEDGLVG